MVPSGKNPPPPPPSPLPPLLEFIDDGLPTKCVFKDDGGKEDGDESREGWRGIGTARRAHYMRRDQPCADGGGLCSPGRWPRASRRLPGGVSRELLDQARKGCQAAVKEAMAGADGVLDLMVKLSLGRVSGPPFPEHCLTETREWIANRLRLKPDQCGVDEGQLMHLGMLSAILKELQDHDWRFVEEIGSRVKLGVDVELPGTPAVFEEKVRWNLDDPDDKMENVSENSGTVEENMA